MSDYEDAVLAFAAAAGNLDAIVTRNTRDFTNSPVSAILPQYWR